MGLPNRNLIVNTTGTDVTGNDFYDVSNAAISSQPKVLGGAIMAAKGASIVDNIAFGQPQSFYNSTRVYRGARNGVTAASITTTISGTVTTSGGYVGIATPATHGLAIGTRLNVGPSGTGASIVVAGPRMAKNALYGVQTITATGAAGIVTDRVYATAYASAQVYCDALNASANFATLTANKYVVAHGNTYTLAGVSNTAMKNMGTSTRHSIHWRRGFRTTKVVTAMRAGYYNYFTGKWSTAPTIALDNAVGGMNTDTQSTLTHDEQGNLIYKYAINPTTATYAARTQ
jgi:hypothetical protein